MVAPAAGGVVVEAPVVPETPALGVPVVVFRLGPMVPAAPAGTFCELGAFWLLPRPAPVAEFGIEPLTPGFVALVVLGLGVVVPNPAAPVVDVPGDPIPVVGDPPVGVVVVVALLVVGDAPEGVVPELVPPVVTAEFVGLTLVLSIMALEVVEESIFVEPAAGADVAPVPVVAFAGLTFVLSIKAVESVVADGSDDPVVEEPRPEAPAADEPVFGVTVEPRPAPKGVVAAPPVAVAESLTPAAAPAAEEPEPDRVNPTVPEEEDVPVLIAPVPAADPTDEAPGFPVAPTPLVAVPLAAPV